MLRPNSLHVLDKIREGIQEASRKLVAIERNTILRDMYSPLESELASIKLKYERFCAPTSANNTPESIFADLKRFLSKINNIIAPHQVLVTSKMYNQTINRLCYRGDSRPPITESGEGIFQTGFTKKRKQGDYKKWIYQFYYSESVTEEMRVIKPFAINRAVTHSTSRDPRSAAFFPIVFKLTELYLRDVIELLQQELEIRRVRLDIKKLLCEQISPDHEYYSESIKSILINILRDYFDNDGHIEEMLLKIETGLFTELEIKDTSWIYVVFVETGFNVSTHGYMYVDAHKPPLKHHYTFFAHEICTDEIASEHIIAAVRIKRDFSNMRLHRETMQSSGRFYGEAHFKIKEVIYNPIALKCFEQYGADVQHYMRLLDHYFEKNLKQPINLSDDGYVQRSTPG